MNINTKNCPICPRACELSAPHCERGAEYARTGTIPQERELGHNHRNGPRLRFEKRYCDEDTGTTKGIHSQHGRVEKSSGTGSASD